MHVFCNARLRGRTFDLVDRFRCSSNRERWLVAGERRPCVPPRPSVTNELRNASHASQLGSWGANCGRPRASRPLRAPRLAPGLLFLSSLSPDPTLPFRASNPAWRARCHPSPPAMAALRQPPPPPELPHALHQYLRLSPLPVLVLHAFSPLDSPPLYINYAWKLLSRGQELLFCVDLAGERAIRRWLTPRALAGTIQAGDGILEIGDDEPELELRFKAPNAGVTTVRWRRTWEGGFVVLTALVFPSARAGPARPSLETRLRELELLTDFSAVGLAR